MVKNKALVIGALGQDGSFMSDILIENGFEVFGLIKKKSINNNYNPQVRYIDNSIGDLKSIIKDINPIHIYNFMGVTNVFDPWNNPIPVYENNFMFPLNVIDIIKEVNINIKFLQSSSSLVFGLNTDSPQNENTKRNPIYHYGHAKNFTDTILSFYREKYNMKLNSVILYPHESERRGDNFFMKKLIDNSIKIKFGLLDKIEFGDIDGYRDIGYAKDYMNACFKIMNTDKCDDYIVGTGKSTKTLDIIQYVFKKLNLNLNENLVINNNLKRDVDLSHLIADTSKVNQLGWKPEKNVNDIIDIMISHGLEKYT